MCSPAIRLGDELHKSATLHPRGGCGNAAWRLHYFWGEKCPFSLGDSSPRATRGRLVKILRTPYNPDQEPVFLFTRHHLSSSSIAPPVLASYFAGLSAIPPPKTIKLTPQFRDRRCSRIALVTIIATDNGGDGWNRERRDWKLLRVHIPKILQRIEEYS